MKFFSYIKSHKLIAFIILLIIISIIMLPIYFLVINKSNSSTPALIQTPTLSPTQTEKTYPTPSPNDLGFVYHLTNLKTRIDDPNSFYFVEMIDNDINGTSYGKEVDTATTHPTNSIQRKWIYDKNNIYTIERTILNTNNAYSQAELSAFGKTNKPNTYLVNQIVSTYDEKNINFTYDISTVITPMILTIYANYKK